MDSKTADIPNTSKIKVVTRKHLFDLFKSINLRTLDERLGLLRDQLFSGEGCSNEQIKLFKSDFSCFKSEFKIRWSKAHSMEDRFVKYNMDWLEGTFPIPVAESPAIRPGRPRKHFEELSKRSKRRKTEDLRSNVDKEVLIHATQVELRKSGKHDASNVLREIVSSPTRATKYKKAYKSSKDKIRPLTTQEAMQMFIDADLSRAQYDIIRSTNKTFFPSYAKLQTEKKKCYPPSEVCAVTSTSVDVELQPLIDLTVKRLSEHLEEVLIRLKESERQSLKLICKWGCDGSQQTQYKQKFENDTESDKSLFQSCFVPLKLVCGQNNEKTIWENPTPSSPRFCRPIRFRFIKETIDVTREEINRVNACISSLIPTEFNLCGKTFSVTHKFIMAMVDGKVCNAATGTRCTTQCYICGAKSPDFNKLDKTKDVNLQTLQFGLSILHARIRLFESILHLAYKLPVKKYRQRKTEAEKQLEDEKKREIQARFRNETGLLIDMPKANFGNTNDGNTSRRFFDDPKLASDITGVSYELIYRLKVILETISSGHKIDSEKYDIYAKETAELYVKLYGWHPMTPTMHKILVHGAVIIKNALLPIGQLTEEAAEARNKHFRSYRLDFARKFTRESCNRDILNRLLLSSDPLLSCRRTVKKTKRSTFLPETMELLLPADPNPECSSGSEDENIIVEAIA